MSFEAPRPLFIPSEEDWERISEHHFGDIDTEVSIVIEKLRDSENEPVEDDVFSRHPELVEDANRILRESGSGFRFSQKGEKFLIDRVH